MNRQGYELRNIISQDGNNGADFYTYQAKKKDIQNQLILQHNEIEPNQILSRLPTNIHRGSNYEGESQRSMKSLLNHFEDQPKKETVKMHTSKPKIVERLIIN